MPKTTATEIKSMRAEILRLTGRAVRSNDPRYLRETLDDVRERQAAGENVRISTGSHKVTVSMPLSVRPELEAVIQRTGASVSEIFRDGLKLWAEKNGHQKLAASIGAE
jgi:hypothetical protein